jgi:predicted TIM-barrel fold metal-dependent hydrolase
MKRRLDSGIDNDKLLAHLKKVEYLEKEVREYPDRFVGATPIEPMTRDEILRMIREEIKRHVIEGH